MLKLVSAVGHDPSKPVAKALLRSHHLLIQADTIREKENTGITMSPGPAYLPTSPKCQPGTKKRSIQWLFPYKVTYGVGTGKRKKANGGRVFLVIMII